MKAIETLSELFEQYVPSFGNCETLGGEIIRATMRIIYRYYNDGDCIGIGYGNETCNSAARFLLSHTNDLVVEEIEVMWGYDYTEAQTNRLAAKVVRLLKENPDVLTTPNTYDYTTFDAPEDFDYTTEEDEEDGW